MAPTPKGLRLAAGQLGGTGKDADKGKGRTQFEDDRRKGNIGKDRPPAYKPQDDGQRGGYAGRSKSADPPDSFGPNLVPGKPDSTPPVPPGPGHPRGPLGGGFKSVPSMSPGGGGRFAAFVSKLEASGKSTGSARAIAATAGRKKYGAAKFNAMGRK